MPTISPNAEQLNSNPNELTAVDESKVSIADKLKHIESHECFPSQTDVDEQGSPLL